MLHVTEISAAFMFLSGLISLFLLLLALNAYRKHQDPAMIYLASAFALFTIKSFLVGYSLMTDLIAHEMLELVDAVGDLSAVLLIVVPVFFRRQKP